MTDDESISLLYSAWSATLNEASDYLKDLRLREDSVPKAPHLENCQLRAQVNQHLDKRFENENFPPWAGWKGLLATHPAAPTYEQLRHFRHQAISEGAYPPWVCFYYLQFYTNVFPYITLLPLEICHICRSNHAFYMFYDPFVCLFFTFSAIFMFFGYSCKAWLKRTPKISQINYSLFKNTFCRPKC